MQSRVHGGNKAEISPMTAASHIPDRTNLYMDGVDANPVYETRTPATDLAPLAKGVLGSRPMHILPPVIVVVVVAPAFDNDAIVQRANAAPRQ